MYYVGIDVHQKRSSVEMLDCNGKLFKRFEVKGRWPVLMGELAKVPRPFAVCYEASCGYGHLFEQFSRLSDRVRVAHPGECRGSREEAIESIRKAIAGHVETFKGLGEPVPPPRSQSEVVAA